MVTFPHAQQLHLTDCGPTCLKMIADYYGIHYHPKYFSKIFKINKKGISMLSLSKAARKLGFSTRGLQIGIEELNEVKLPIIVHWNQSHYVVLFHIENEIYYIADPASKILKYTKQEFIYYWSGGRKENKDKGVVLTFFTKK